MLILKEIKKVAKDYLFPIFCLGCGVEGCWVCESCKNRFEVVDSTEFFDKKMSNIKVLFSALQYYEESLLGKAFKIFKYEFSEEVFGLFESINLKNAFELNKKYYFSNKVVLLIDDVYTTGATIHECSQLFENKKVKGIYAFTLFRGR